jgi:GT2 family glycosyltransferase
MFHAEDIELSYRIRHKGFDLTYQDSAQVYHRRRSKISQFVMQLFHMGKARVTLARLHPSSLEFLHVLPALALTIVVLLSILSLTWQPAFSLLKLFGGFAILLIVLIGIDGALRLHSFRALFLTPLLFMLQQAAYGSGFLISLLTPKR